MKFRLVIWSIILIIAISMLWISNENRIQNKKIIEIANICEAYQEGDYVSINKICRTEPIKGLADYKIGDYQITFDDLNVV